MVDASRGDCLVRMNPTTVQTQNCSKAPHEQEEERAWMRLAVVLEPEEVTRERREMETLDKTQDRGAAETRKVVTATNTLDHKPMVVEGL
jgi:hypothetical protein